jgi:glycosyltransferase involved in cell wall biosynthesis
VLKSRKNSVVFTWSERAGIPFALFNRYLLSKIHFITMFQCWSKRQEAVITNLGLFSTMDEILVHCKSMKQNLVGLGASEHKVRVLHYSIDQVFFSPLTEVEPQKNLVVSIGESRSRNYLSLFKAIEGLPINLQLPAYGHWYAREKKGGQIWHPPPNVTLLPRLSPTELRGFYARAQFTVLPVQNLVYSAGATATLEANCMARPVIAYHSPGIIDYIIDGETGMLVEPDNTMALREAIQYLLANPAEAKRMGENARQRILEQFRFEIYVEGIANIMRSHGV